MAPRKKIKKQKKGSRRKPKQELATITFPEVLPVLPAKDLVAFPNVMMSLHVGRPASVKAVETALESDKLIFIVAQLDHDLEDPQSSDLHKVGVLANIARVLKLSDGRYKVLIQGIVRGRAERFRNNGAYYTARVTILGGPDSVELTAEDEAIVSRIRQNLQLLVERDHLPEEMLLVTEEIEDPSMLSDVILAHYKLDLNVAQSALEELDPMKRIKFTDSIISDDLNQLLLSEAIKDKARDEMAKGQKEYYLREQIKQIHKELGEGEAAFDDLSVLKASLEKAKLPKHANTEAFNQFRRLEKMHPESSEYALIRTYLEWMSDLPWSKTTKDRLDLDVAKKILDQDHAGLEKAKDRILEYLSVRKLNRHSKGPILCFVGPPGVGKTSLGRSIAQALDRKFFRMSLGGVRDEAEIRGHRRTYVGALPGRIVQGLKQAGTRNPVVVLDELDKVGADFRGDPASALLEVLDPAQNKEFRDHYLNVDFDLSDVLFIATANTLDTIPEALLDRLEVIFISGYTTEEKIDIAKRFLIPRQMEENGLGKIEIKYDDKALLYLIERYTSEAGVRNLEREIGSLCRKIAREKLETGKMPAKITRDVVENLLGATKFDPEATEMREVVGLARGLAWTVHGGEVMPVEASIAKGTGQLTLTGQLGSVMQESAQAAVFFARANADVLGLDREFNSKFDIHVHVPGGATPKDGPSAGVTIVSALVSALSNRAVRNDVAMTGEITLRGNVMAIGGLKEKVLAAIRHGIKRVIIPFENIKDLEEIPKEQRSRIKFFPVKHVGEVLQLTLAPKDSSRSRMRGGKSSKHKKMKPSIHARV